MQKRNSISSPARKHAQAQLQIDAVCRQIREPTDSSTEWDSERERVHWNQAVQFAVTRFENCVRKPLPVFGKRKEILESLRDHDVVIVTADTGSGKSTQIPQLENFNHEEKNAA